MTHRVNLNRVWRDIAETIQTAARIEKIREVVEAVRAERAECSEEEKLLLAAQPELARYPGQGVGVRLQLAGLLLLALVLLIADVPVQFALNASSLPQVPTWIWVVSAPAIAVGLGALVHGAAVSFLYDKVRPARSIRLCRTLAWVTFFAALVAGGVILFARVASPAAVPYIVDLASVSVWVVAETLPAAAGLFLAWAHFLSVPTRERRMLREIQQRGARLDSFLDQLTIEEESLSRAEEDALSPADGPPSPEPTGPRSPAGHTVSIALALLVPLLGTAASGLDGQEPIRICGAAVDRTASVGADHRDRAVEFVADGLEQLVSLFGCGELVIVNFTDEGRWAPRRWFHVPQPVQLSDCSNVERPSLRGSSQLLMAFSGFQTHFAAAAVRACQDRAIVERRSFEEEWGGFVTGVHAGLTDAPTLRATRTDIAGVIEGLVASDVQTLLVVTDGIDTAHEGFPVVSLPPGARVIFVLVPAAPEYGGRAAADKAGESWARLGPGATVVRYLDLAAPSVWVRLAAGDAQAEEVHER